MVGLLIGRQVARLSVNSQSATGLSVPYITGEISCVSIRRVRAGIAEATFKSVSVANALKNSLALFVNTFRCKREHTN